MTALQTLGYNIVDHMNRTSKSWAEDEDNGKYNGWFSITALTEVVCNEMFHHDVWGTQYIKDRGRFGHVYPKMLASKEEREKITKVIKRMEAKGIIKFSKSRQMVKPMVTADEWLERVQRGEA